MTVDTGAPRLANATERRIHQLLGEQLGDDGVVIAGMRVTDHLKDHEVDFLVAIEGAGIVCVEVKDGDVWRDGQSWRQIQRGKEYAIEPVRQAREACYALRSFIEHVPRWAQGRLRWDHVIVLPNTELPEWFELVECPRWKAFDRNDLDDLVGRMRKNLHSQEIDRPVTTDDVIDQLVVSLSGRGLPQRDVVARALENEDAADVLTEHQSVILDAVRLLNRVEIRGGAGSGKTFLAMEQARRLTRGGKRVAVFGAHHRRVAALSATRVCRRVPRSRQDVGCSRRPG